MAYRVRADGALIGREDGLTLSEGPADRRFEGNGYRVRVLGEAQPGGAWMTTWVDASVNVHTEVSIVSQALLELVPPAGGFAAAAGGRLVIEFDVEFTGEIGLGTVEVQIANPSGPIVGRWSHELHDMFSGQLWPFEVAVPLPADATTQPSVTVIPRIELSVTRSGAQNWSKGVKEYLKWTRFRVLDASGVQVKGFRMQPEGFIPEVGSSEGTARAIEYYNASYGTYFVTHLPQEIADLDGGRTTGWLRTGESFNVWPRAFPDASSVCRFYGVFGTKSSHFYAPYGLGCEALQPAHPDWRFEGHVFYAQLPKSDARCASNSIPVYRYYNNGIGGVPNHRYVTSDALRRQMGNEGWTLEGNDGIGMCVPE